MNKDPSEKLARGKGYKVGRTLDAWDLKDEIVKAKKKRLGYPKIVRPRTRGDCARIPRPCPFVSCRYHLYLDVKKGGNLMMNFPDIEPDQMEESCALDVAELGGQNTEEIGEIMRMSRQAIHAIEQVAKAKIWASKQIKRIGKEHGIELKWRSYYRSKSRTKQGEYDK